MILQPRLALGSRENYFESLQMTPLDKQTLTTNHDQLARHVREDIKPGISH